MSEAVDKRDRAPGALLLDGKYRLEAPVAVGGMGSVWRARHITLDRPVAVKFVDVGRSASDVVERFLREAKVAAAIRHPNVVDILDFGTTESGEPLMVMELLEGQPLSERLFADEPLPTMTTIRIAAQILSGLEAVHRTGIVHRDLKPANVFLSEDADGELFARLLDFGISFSLDPTSELRRGRFGTDERLVIGTPEYMAPEQAEGRPDVDLRADVYSTAVIVYEALSGVLPYAAEHPGQVMAKVMNGGAMPLVELRPDIPEIAAAVMIGMARAREDRPDSARDFRRLLLSSAGMSGDTTGRFQLSRGSGIRRSLPASDPPSGRTSAPPVERDAPTAPQGVATPTPASPITRPSTIPPPASAGALLYVGVGVALTVAVAVGLWVFGARGGAPAAEAPPPAPLAVELAPPTPPPVAALAEPAPAVPAVAVPEPAPVPAAATPPAVPSASRRPRAAPAPTSTAEVPVPAAPAEGSRTVVRDLDF